MLYSGMQKKGVDKEVLNYLCTTDYRRKVLMDQYSSEFENVGLHLCCDNCAN